MKFNSFDQNMLLTFTQIHHYQRFLSITISVLYEKIGHPSQCLKTETLPPITLKSKDNEYNHKSTNFGSFALERRAGLFNLEGRSLKCSMRAKN